jgi:hypothetical protein
VGLVHAARLAVLGRGRGYLPDAPDDRDVLFAAPPLEELVRPINFSLLVHARERRDQGATSMCVAFGTAHAIGIRERFLGVELPPVSVMSMYSVSRSYHQVKLVDQGTYPRTLCKGLAKLGVPLEEDWPFNPAHVNRRPPPQCFLRGFARRGGTYQRIAEKGTARVEAICAAIAGGLPVTIGTMVEPSFGNLRGPRLIERPRDGARLAGGHLMVIVGYSNHGARFEVLNSYGPTWRDDGVCELTADYVAWEGTQDLTIIDGWEGLRAA